MDLNILSGYGSHGIIMRTFQFHRNILGMVVHALADAFSPVQTENKPNLNYTMKLEL